ncbi:MAG: acyltransferase family protein [Prolixibacteraceae bacterium]|nr:acyltransferase family protein [Prolixibacteraceae bacterium]
MKNNRLFYIDNLRIFLIGLVVLHHFAITYGAPGGWYYNESEAGMPEGVPMSMFVATNQSFFMGMFFLISAFFMAASLKRKNTGKFLKDRLIRLGLPLLVFYFILSPLTNFIRSRYIYHVDETFIDFLTRPREWGFGPMWFVEALLIFTIIFLLIRPLKIKIRIRFPGTVEILLAAVFTGLLQFIIRLWLPVGWSLPHTNLQFPFFIQYIFLFIVGIIAFQNNWLESITFRMAKYWFLFAQVMIFIGFPLLFVLGGAAEYGTDPFMGGMKWQSLGYALWEQVTGFSIVIGLFGLFHRYFNSQGKFAQQLSGSAYGVFLLHPPVIVGLSAIFAGWDIFPPLKFILLAPLAVIACFLVAWLVRQVPGIKRVL